ncbi:hypothetical protein MNBD_GAMMA19-1244 [hydrothermal vent metagenome]|uniref:Uncharacterized protein n=1 Tax=hydrothermal vent metagenome TaxID=652676 RepID=A0A3B1AUG3_9ZZZZ
MIIEDELQAVPDIDRIFRASRAHGDGGTHWAVSLFDQD